MSVLVYPVAACTGLGGLRGSPYGGHSPGQSADRCGLAMGVVLSLLQQGREFAACPTEDADVVLVRRDVGRVDV